MMATNASNRVISQKLSNLKILSFNVDGLDSMLLDPEFMDLAQDHDICILTETMRKDDTKLNIENFWDFSLVRPKTSKIGRYSGGITLLIKTPLRPGIKIVHRSEGIVWFRLNKEFFNFNEDLYICAVYISPQSSKNPIAKKTDYFNDLLLTTSKFLNMGDVMLTGDFNSRIGSDTVDEDPDIPFISELLPVSDPVSELLQRTSCDVTKSPYGTKLINLCQSLNLKIANGRCPGDMLGNYTCFSNKGASVVDYVIADSRILSNISYLKVLPPAFSSVHSPISTNIRCDTLIQQKIDDKTLALPTKIKWDSSKTDAFRASLETPATKQKLIAISQRLQCDDLTLAETSALITQFSDLVVSGAKACMKLVNTTPKNIPGRGKSLKTKDFKWYSTECIKLKRRLQSMAKRLQRRPKDPLAHNSLSQVKKEYRKTVKKAKQAYEVDAIKKLESKANNPKEFWKYFKSLGHKTDSKNLTPTSDEWVDHFSSLYSGNHSLNSSPNQKIVNTVKTLSQKLDSRYDMTSTDDSGADLIMAPFEVGTVLKGIQRLKGGKAVASDLISNDMIKASGDIIAPALTLLFNRILKNEYPPDVWGLGIIVPLLKSGDPTDVNNYRGITINSCLSKLFMLLLNDRLQAECDNRNIILYNQIGFRKLFRPADHVFTLKTLIDKAFSEKKQLYTCFVDFKKAYDTVWRDGLFYKLLKNGISRKFVRLLRNIYSASSLCIKVPGGRSIDFPSAVGLKQGCNLSPLLFNIFINDFLTEINGHQKGSPYLGEIAINALFYADDLVLISETKEGLQALLDKLHSYTKTWCLQVNKSKTKCIVFSAQKKPPINVVNFGGAPLVTAETYCYLGTIFSRNGSLNEAGHILHKKAIKALHGLIQKVYKYKSCDPKIMLDLFDKMILPVAMYNSEIWGTMCFPVNENNTDFLGVSPQKNPVEDVQIRFCKRLLGVRDKTSNWGVTSELGRHPTIILIMEKIIRFWDHVIQSRSPILKAALQTNINLDASGKRVWFSFLRCCLK